jgi:3-oxoacyl-[acyl-carrier-protein] synthase-1
VSASPVAILGTGLVTSAGLSAAAASAAIRAKISNPTVTRFVDANGEWIVAHEVPLEKPWRGRAKLAKMAAMAIEECLREIAREDWAGIPLLLCVAERERPGRFDGLDDQLFLDIEDELGVRFAPDSAIVAEGRVGVGIALRQARKLLGDRESERILIAATDSLLAGPTLRAYEAGERLLTAENSNGFIPGEASGALLVGPPSGKPQLLCTGVGLAIEKAHIDAGEPLRAEGLTRAITEALAEAGCGLHDLDFRITDVSGEQYYFKEAALAVSRILRQRMEEFEIWHPAESIGEAGAAVGSAIIAVADAACRKAYAAGPNILVHMSADAGRRAAAVLRFSGA